MTSPSTVSPELNFSSTAVPGALVLGTLLGEDETALLVLLLENQSLDLVVHGDDVSRVDILADGELAGRE